MKLKKITALFLVCVFLQSICPAVFAAGTAMTLESCSEYGNINEPFEVCVNVKSSEEQNVQVKLSVKKDGDVVDSVSDSFSTKNKSGDLTYFLSLSEAGEYEFNFSGLVAGKEIASETKTVYMFDGKSSFSDMGFCTHYDFNHSFRKLSDMKAAKAAGFTMVRDECRWSKVETTKGVYQIPEHIRNYIDYAYKNGTEVLLILAFGNKLYTDGESYMPVGEEQLEAFGKYCAYVANEFKGKVKYFEIWNEPNHKGFNAGDASATDYVALMKTAYNAVKSVNSEAYLMGISEGERAESYVRDVLEAGGGKYMDAVSIHPYACWMDNIAEETYMLDTEVTAVKKAITDAGLDLPIWITEVGYRSSTGTYTSEQKAAYNVRTAVEFKSDSRIDKMFFYELHSSSPDINDSESNFGFLNYDGSPSVSFDMILNANNILANADFVQKWQSNKYYTLYKFRDRVKNEDIFVLWTKGSKERKVSISADADSVTSGCVSDTANVTIDIGTSNSDKKLHCYDAYGKREIRRSTTEVTADFKPMFIVCRDAEPGKYFDISLKDGNIVAEGRIDDANTEVTLKAVEKGGDIYYVNQTTTDGTGAFSFSFKALQNGVSEVYVYNGEQKNKTINNGGLDADVTLKVADKVISDISEITKGDVVKAELSVDNKKYPNLKDVCFAAAVYTEGNQLIVTEIDEKKLSSDGTGLLSVEIPTDNLKNWNNIKFFLWDLSTLKPYMKKIKK